jgi:hypothetical protein
LAVSSAEQQSRIKLNKDCHPAKLCYAGNPLSGADFVPEKDNGLTFASEWR